MNLQEIKQQVEAELSKEAISSRILLDRLRVIDESSRKTSAYVDPRYIPFYHHFAKYVEPKSVIEFGFGIGLCSAVFLNQCKTVKHFLGFQETGKEYYSTRLGRVNIKLSYKNDGRLYAGKIYDEEFQKLLVERQWDLAMINEELSYDTLLAYLETTWTHMKLGGLIVVDYITSHIPAKKTYEDFCKIKNREPLIISTRYGIGVIQK